EPLLLRALVIYRKVLPPPHFLLALVRNELAYGYHDRLQFDQAETLYREALDIGRQSASANTLEFAHSLNNLAALLADRGRVEEALPLYDESLRIRAEHLGEAHPGYLRALGNRGEAHAYAG